jgi:hypothetical protein
MTGPLTTIAESIDVLRQSANQLHKAAKTLGETSAALAEALSELAESLAIGGEEARGEARAMTIGEAIKVMWDGGHVARAGWNGKNMWLALQPRGEDSKMTEPYNGAALELKAPKGRASAEQQDWLDVYMSTAQGGLIPWLCSQADLLAEDWLEVVVDEKLHAGQRP